jgi:hypothetical protein
MSIRWLLQTLGAIACGIALTCCSGHTDDVFPGTSSDSTQSYIAAHNLSPRIVKFSSGGFAMTLTPNYSPKFGPMSQLYCNCASYRQVTPGPFARLGAGAVDFGNVDEGQDYLYKYAVQVSITAPTAWYLFGETTNNFSTTLKGNMLLWLASRPGNDDGSAGKEFASSTSASVGWHYPVDSGPKGKTSLDYDYILRLQWNVKSGSYFTQVMYTAVPS